MKSFLLTLASLICSVFAEDFLRGRSVRTNEQRGLQSRGKVLYLRLVDASSNSVGNNIIIEKIVNGTVIDFSKFSSNQAFNVEAVTNGTIGSIQFKYNNNAPFRPEGLKPYSMCGDVAGVFKPCAELNLNGFHSVTATPWSGIKGNGTMGKPINVFFRVTNGISTPTPPRPAPVQAPSSVRPVPVPIPVRSLPVPTPVRSLPVPAPVRPLPIPTPVRPLPVPTPVRLPAPIKSPVPVPSAGQWIEVNRNATEIIRRHEACFVMVGRKAYLLGGRYREDNAVDIYDPVSRTWSKGQAPPMEIHHTQCVVVDGKIWIASSWTGNFPREKNTEFVFIYDPVDDAWFTKPGLPEERRRGGAASVLVGRKIYISHGNRGGHETGNFSTSLGWLDYYDIDEEKWYTNLPDAPNPRDHTGGALVNGQICVAGGRDGGSIGFFDLTILPTDCFDLSRNKWVVKADIPQGRAGSAYGTTCDGMLMVAGGEGGGQAWSNVDVFDGESWTSLDSLNRARHGTGLAVDCVCNQIYIASGGGKQGGGIELSSVETYFPSGMDTICNA